MAGAGAEGMTKRGKAGSEMKGQPGPTVKDQHTQ